jgi:filamentous hemagglutinin family protein
MHNKSNRSRLIALALLVMLAASPTAEAGNILRRGGSSASSAAVAASGRTGAAAMMSSPGMVAAQNALSRATAAVMAVQAMQRTAQQTAQMLARSYLTPHVGPLAGQALLIVPDGLVDNTSMGGAGGLIPDSGLASSGEANPVTTWVGANTPVQTGPSNQPTVTITQTAQTALLYWQTFNVGPNTTLNFDQLTYGGANVANWIAFNKISATGVPSQILGHINAAGQVYVINPNGIIFGGTSQVNTHALVASSLPINTDLITSGLPNNPSSEFLFSAVTTGAFTPPVLGPGQGVYGDVEVQPGAQLNAVPTPDNAGGLVALVGPNVYNGGTINTPNGQTILAAGYQVGLAAHASNDPTLRGLDAFVGLIGTNDPNSNNLTSAQQAQLAQLAGQPAGGIAENADPDPTTGAVNTGNMGDIESHYGDAMMVGQTVNQFGIINSLTSVSYNGRIDLLADYDTVVLGSAPSSFFSPTFTGPVVLGPGSATQILPDMAAQTVGATQLALPSLIDIQGQSIHLEANFDGSGNEIAGTGAVILAPGAIAPTFIAPGAATPTYADAFGNSNGNNPTLDLAAGVTLNAGSWAISNNVYYFNNASTPSGQTCNITLDPDAMIDVSGSQGVSASVTQNIVPVQLLSAQLADSPLERGGSLYRQTVDVDITQTGEYDGQWWAGTPLADTTGFINQIQRTVGELTTNGGTVALAAGDQVALGANSTINVSASAINYTGGIVSTSKVIADGHILDISKATPDLVYSGVYTGTHSVSDAKWGVTQTYTSPKLGGGSGQYDPGYLQWGNAGSIAITAPSMALNGNNFYGNTGAGPYQRTPLAQISSEFGSTIIFPTMAPILGVPMAGALSLNFESGYSSDVTFLSGPPAIEPDVYIQSGSNSTTLGSATTPSSVLISTDLVNSDGFGNLAVFDPTGNVEVKDTLIIPDSIGGGNGVNTSLPSLTTLQNGLTQSLENGGNISLTGKNIAIDSGVEVSAPSGTLSFTVNDVSPLGTPPTFGNTLVPAVNTNGGQFTLGSGATLSTAGLIVDDSEAAAAPGTLPLATNGGAITIKAYQVDLQSESVVDVSGGVQMTAAGKLAYGSGGALTISALDPVDNRIGLLPGSVPVLPSGAPDYGQLAIDPTAILEGYSGKTGSGGTLSLTAPFIQVGGNQLLNGDTTSTGRTLWLNQPDANGNPPQPGSGNDFFSTGGFSNFTLAGLGDFAPGDFNSNGTFAANSYTFMPALVIAPGAQIYPQVSSYEATLSAGGDLELMPTLAPNGQRAPANLTFSSLGKSALFFVGTPGEGLRGDLVVYSGAVIETDPQVSGPGSVTLNAAQTTGNTVTMLGSIKAPGGNISITGALPQDETGNILLFAQPGVPTVDLGPESVLDASGVTVSTTLDYSRGSLTTGTVLPGGNISITGNIVIEDGATLNVDGSSGSLDQLSADVGPSLAQSGKISGSNYVAVQEESNGGTINLAGNDELFVGANAKLEGFAGGPMAQGGSLAVSSSYYHGSASALATQATLFLTQSGTPFSVGGPSLIVSGPPGSVPGGPPLVVGNPVVGADGVTPLFGEGYFAADTFNNGGFASLTLGEITQGSPALGENQGSNGTVEFSGKVTLNASNSLTVATAGILLGDANSTLTLNAPYVALGQPFLVPGQAQSPLTNVTPTYGSGSLYVNASDLIDVGTLYLQNISVANLDATNGNTTNGAIRGDGTLDVTGAITMKAGQIYPPTAATFNIEAYSNTINPTIQIALSSANNNQVALASSVLPSGFGIGSSLLGSTVTNINGTQVTLASDANAAITNAPAPFNYSSVTILPGPGLPALPLSAGGTLNIYASTINQAGVLRAPIGTIDLGWNGTGTAPTDPVLLSTTTSTLPSAQTLTLASGSMTSVSAVDPVTGEALTIPYGIILNGTDWIDPTGTKITATGNGAAGAGVPFGNISLNAANVSTDSNATIDLAGGGDLYAYRWVPGLGGSYDILNSTYNAHTTSYSISANSALSAMSFAVIPGYSTDYAPFAPYNNPTVNFSTPNPVNPAVVNPTLADPTNNNTTNPTAIVDAGYTNPSLSVGEKVYLGASNGLPAGYYTLLPARYALLPGAFLVTPQSGGAPAGVVARPDGSSLVPGYMYNDRGLAQTLLSAFEVDPQSVVLARAEYDPSSANSFLSQSALANHDAVPRLPVDAGQLVFNLAASQPGGTTLLDIQSETTIDAQAPDGLGGLVDISSPGNIVIEPNGTSSPGNLVLDPTELDTFNAESLLVGGFRQSTNSGMTATVTATNLTVNNSSATPLKGSDVILAANTSLTVDPGAVISALDEPFAPAQTLQVGQTFIFANNSALNVRAGSAISFPQTFSSTSDYFTASGAGGFITPPNGGTPINFSAGTATITSSMLTPGSTITFNSGGGQLVFNGASTDKLSITIGDGTLLRVSSDPTTSIVRSDVTGSPALTPAMNIGSKTNPGAQGATITGASVTLDSTGSSFLAANANLSGTTANLNRTQSINLDSGQISLQLGSGGSPQGLVLTGGLVNELEQSVTSLSLLSYSSIDIYSSSLGINNGVSANDVIGSSSFGSLALHAGEIRGFAQNAGDSMTFAAQNILLDNSANGTVPGQVVAQNGSLTFDAGAGTIELGANQLDIDQYNSVTMRADGGIIVQGTGGLTAQGSLAMETPLLTGASGANQTITAGALPTPAALLLGLATTGGSLSITNVDGVPVPVVNNLGASLNLVGAQNGVTAGDPDGVAVNSNIVLPSGTLNIEADKGNLSVDAGGLLDVSGTAQPFGGGYEYTGGGQITLKSDAGNVSLAAGSQVNVSARPQAGNAGSLTISAPSVNNANPNLDGTFIASGTLLGQGGAGGQAGTFSLDVGSLSGASLDFLAGILSPDGFTHSISIRDRGDQDSSSLAVTLDPGKTLKANTVNISTDAGSIGIAGTIAASGQTGGTINLEAEGNVTLSAGSLLTVEGVNFNDAGKGGAVSLAAGCYEAVNGVSRVNTGATVNIDPNSTINLKVDSNIVQPSQVLSAGGSLSFSNNPITSVGGNEYITVTNTGAATGIQIGTITCVGLNNNITTSPLYANDLTVVNGASSITLNSGISGTVNFPGSTAVGDYTGTLQVSESQTAFANGGNGATLLNSLGSNIKNASNIVLAGLEVFDLSGTTGTTSTTGSITSIGTGGSITNTGTDNVQQAVMTNGNAFVNGVYNNTSNKSFLQSNPEINIEPEAEIVNNGGNLTLAATWDLSQFRFGPNVDGVAGDGSGEPGILTLRAAGNLVFDSGASLTDGFDTSTAKSAKLVGSTYTPQSAGNIGALYAPDPVWTAQLMPVGMQSWSYNLVAGADLSAADYSRVMPLTKLSSATGSLELGFGASALPSASAATDLSIIPNYYQVIRTGTGNINIFAGEDVQLLDPLAAIYTSGSQASALPTDEFTSSTSGLAYYPSSGITDPNYTLSTSTVGKLTAGFVYPAQYSQDGGNVTISAQYDIIHETSSGAQDSSKELPTNWLYRRGYVNPATGAFATTHTLFGTGTTTFHTPYSEIASTTWWIDFSNFFEGVGALGGGNVTLAAGHDVSNVDAVAPTNARVTKQLPSGNGTSFTNADGTSGTYNQTAADQAMVELGGGDVVVSAGDDINGGVYYVERGQGTLSAGNQIMTNATRSTVIPNPSDATYQLEVAEAASPLNWLPTTLFLGSQSSFDVTAGGAVTLGPVANPFLQPQGIGNSYFDKTYFSTYSTTDAVDVSSLTGNVTLQDNPFGGGSLSAWYGNVLEQDNKNSYSNQQPWLGLAEYSAQFLGDKYFTTAAALMPGTLQATAFSGNLNLVGSLTLSPSPNGTIDFAAAGSIDGLQPNSVSGSTQVWYSSTIDLSDASPNNLPGIYAPLSLTAATGSVGTQNSSWANPEIENTGIFQQSFTALFNVSGATNTALQAQETLHGTSVSAITGLDGPLHVNDANPVQLYSATGDISGLELFAGKAAQVVAGSDITDIALYLQNDNPGDVSVVDAGRDIIAYDPNSPLNSAATAPGNKLESTIAIPEPETGDIQIAGPGTLEVLAGRNLTLGISPTPANNGIDTGITSIGGTSNPALPFAGANVVATAGLGSPATGLEGSSLDFNDFINQYLAPTSSYWPGLLPELQTLLPGVNFSAGLPVAWSDLTAGQQQILAPQILDTFYLVLRDAGRNHSTVGNYNTGFAAIAALFPTHEAWQGDMTLTSREIKTENGGDIDLLAPGGQLTVGLPVSSGSPADQGVLTDAGGNISIFTNGNVTVGVSRIFTLLGGNEIIWSSTGNIAAGASSKTVSAAPPTRVIVNPTSFAVTPDLAGLATGGGIGVLATVAGVTPGNVDLIAPAGTIDAGDAGIRSSGSINISAVTVLNSSNIQAGGTVSGTPPPPAAPNIGGIAAASNTGSASASAAAEVAKQGHAPVQQEQFPSIITVEVLGYGGDDGDGS